MFLYESYLYFVNRSFNLDVEVESPRDLLKSNSKLQNVSSSKTKSKHYSPFIKEK